MVKIGAIALETAVPDNLDRRLVALTGLDAARMRDALAGACSAQEVAGALAPLVTEPLHRVELARMIAAADIDAVRRDVLRVYDEAAGASPPANSGAPAGAKKGRSTRAKSKG